MNFHPMLTAALVAERHHRFLGDAAAWRAVPIEVRRRNRWRRRRGRGGER